MKRNEVINTAEIDLFTETIKDETGNHIVKVTQVADSEAHVCFQALIDGDQKVNVSYSDGKWVDDDKNEETELSKVVGQLIENHLQGISG